MQAQPEPVTHPDALEHWQERERAAFRDVFRPAPHVSPSEWADEHRVISQGPQRGQRWTNETTPYLVEILDFIASPWTRRGVVRKSSRVGYTEGVIGNAVCWTIDVDPCPIAVVQPSDEQARAYSKEQITPLLDYNPVVGGRLGELGVRASDSTIVYKEFPGGFLSILGSASDKNMRRRSFKRMFVDEVDGMRMDSAEGDPLSRFEKRTDDFEDDAGVMIVGSTPVLKHLSRIDREFERSDRRFWHVPCPHCKELQVLRWGGPDTPFGIKWDRELACKACGSVAEVGAPACEGCKGTEFAVHHLPESAYYLCEHCGEAIDESDKEAMVQAGRWIATNPLGRIPGWHIDALISLFPAARWGRLAAEFLEAVHDPSDLQVFWNTVLGLAFEERSEKVEVSKLERRAEEYVDAGGKVVDVPDGVGVLTAFVDVQGSWLELLVRGWGLEEESWDILHQRITGAPDAQSTWAILDGFLTRRFRNVHGAELGILCTLVDAGAYTDNVYSFVKPREPRHVYASMGDKTGDPDAVPLRTPVKANAAGVRVWTIGTYKAKAALFRRLGIERPGPRFMHLRAYNGDRCNGFDAEYYAQFEAEKRVVRRAKGMAKAKPMFVQTRERNEAIDLHVGNMAALMVRDVRAHIAAWVEAARQAPEPPKEQEPQRKVAEQEGSWATSGLSDRGNDWVGGWR